jgi:hypothetical protein
MAVTRPLKEGSVTTYQQKVAAGFPDILASEMDADLDTIYAAWNGNVGTANLVDGSVTYAKLAPDAQLWRDTGTTLVPGTSFATRIVAVPGDTTGATVLLGNATAKGRVQGLTTTPGTVGILANRNWAASNAQDDATKPSWAALLNCAGDNFQVQRSPAGSTTQTNLLTLDAIGNLTLSPPGAGIAAFLGFAYGGTPIFRGYGAGGTAAAPTPLAQYGQLATFQGAGCYQAGTNYATQAQLFFFAQEAWTGTARGCSAQLALTPVGTTTLGGKTINFDHDGSLRIDGPTGQKSTGTTWTNPSDPRLKADVGPYARGLAEIIQLAPISYHLKSDPDGPLCYGFDASAVKEIFPECVGTTMLKLDPADPEATEVLSFDMHPILVAIINAIKELHAR